MSPGARPGGGFGGSSSFGSGGEGYGAESGGSFGSSGGGLTTSRPGIPRMNGAGLANSGLIQQSMTDPNLAEVWIGGLVTLFRPIEEQPVEEAAEGYGTEPETTTDQVPEESAEVSEVDENVPAADTETESDNDAEAAPATENSEAEETAKPATDAEGDSEAKNEKPPADPTEN